MKLDELKQYTRLKSDEIFYLVEIERLKQIKKTEIQYYSSPSLSTVPSGEPSSPTERLAVASIEFAEKVENRTTEMKQRLAETRQRLKEIDGFIQSVEDSETKAMLRRHIKQRVSYNQIAKEFFVSRNYVAKRIKGVCDEER